MASNEGGAEAGPFSMGRDEATAGGGSSGVDEASGKTGGKEESAIGGRAISEEGGGRAESAIGGKDISPLKGGGAEPLSMGGNPLSKGAWATPAGGGIPASGKDGSPLSNMGGTALESGSPLLSAIGEGGCIISDCGGKRGAPLLAGSLFGIGGRDISAPGGLLPNGGRDEELSIGRTGMEESAPGKGGKPESTPPGPGDGKAGGAPELSPGKAGNPESGAVLERGGSPLSLDKGGSDPGAGLLSVGKAGRPDRPLSWPGKGGAEESPPKGGRPAPGFELSGFKGGKPAPESAVGKAGN